MHQAETHLIPLALEAAVGIRPELEVFGADYPTPDDGQATPAAHCTPASGRSAALVADPRRAEFSAALEGGPLATTDRGDGVGMDAAPTG